MINKSKTEYLISGKIIKVPENKSCKEYVFDADVDRLVNTNHEDTLAIVCKEQELVDMSYSQVKMCLRKDYVGKKVFVVAENFKADCKLTGESSKGKEWIVAINDDKTYYMGDSPRQETFDHEKLCDLIRLKAIVNGELMTLVVVKDSSEDTEFFKNLAMRADKYMLRVKGMLVNVIKKNKVFQEIIVTRVEVIEESYDKVGCFVKNVNSVADIMTWRNLRTHELVPSVIESEIIMSALFFTYEGYAAINLFVIGPPSCGKSFLLDTFGYALNQGVHACGEMTAKGLVYSHVEGGRLGVLYREKYCALLNEFVRLFTKSASQGSREAEELFSALNDAVEKKPNRKRSSGYVSDADAKMVCSMITSDNDYKPKIAPFANAMISDPSYMRRYSILVLSEETVEKGLLAKVEVTDWRVALEKSLRKAHMSLNDWVILMKYLRSQVDPVLNSNNFTRFAKYANCYKEQVIKELFAGGSTQDYFSLLSSKEEDLHHQINEADFMQVGVACAVSSTILGSLYRCNSGLPQMKMNLEDEKRACDMIKRLIDDMFKLLKPYIAEKRSHGVERV